MLFLLFHLLPCPFFFFFFFFFFLYSSIWVILYLSYSLRSGVSIFGTVCVQSKDGQKKKAKIAYICYIWQNFHMQETNYVLLTIYSPRQSWSLYTLASSLRKLWFFLYLLDLAFIPLEERKLLKKSNPNALKKKRNIFCRILINKCMII